jgi:dienelactone hydrolase
MFKSIIIGYLIAAVTVSAFAESTYSLDNQDFKADYTPAKVQKKYGILVLGGSGGGKPAHLATKIAQSGRAVLSLAYFKEDGLPAELNEIPLEYFDAPKRWLMTQSDTRDDGIIVVGWSKGAELSLLLASKSEDYKGVIGIAPSSVIWAGILNDWQKIPSSSWTSSGQPLPHVPFASGVKINKLIDLYKASLEQEELVNAAILSVEDITGPVLLLSGGKDEIWPASEMATVVCARMQEAKKLCKHVDYPDAGHLLDEDYIIGGTKASNAAANKASTKLMLEFIEHIE